MSPLRNPRIGRRDGERGATMAVFAVVLSALLAVTSLSVDLGRAYTERRLDQNAADVAVMSAAVVASLGGGLDAVVDEVRTRVDANLGRTVSDAEWQSCTDPERLAVTAADLTSDGSFVATECISFARTFDQIRVRIPEQEVPSIFAAVIGAEAIRTSASAASGFGMSTGRGAQPFVTFRGASAGDFVCLRTGGSSAAEPESLMQGNGPGTPPSASNPEVLDPCDSARYDVARSTFGTVLPYAYRLDPCGTSNAEVRRAIMVGSDHPYTIFPGGYASATEADVRVDGDPGGTCSEPFPNTLIADTGFDNSILGCALLGSESDGTCEGLTALLRQGGNWETSPTRLLGQPFDNTAPWSHLLEATELLERDAPDACVLVAASRPDDGFVISSDTFATFVAAHPQNGDDDWDQYDRYDTFIQCLEDWEAGSDPVIFDDVVLDAPRFMIVPQVDELTISSSLQHLHINGFAPMYLYRSYIGVNNEEMCGADDDRVGTKYIVHDAGDPTDAGTCGTSAQSLDRISGIVLGCGMVPAGVCSKPVAGGDGPGTDVYDVRLDD